LLFEFDFGLHEHEDGVLTDLEVLGEGLLEVVLRGFDTATLTVDEGCEDVGFDEGRVFLEAVV
jgi:hypothetical protein